MRCASWREGRGGEERGTILCSLPFAKHEGRHTPNQNDPHWCPQRTVRACLCPLIAFARTCAFTNKHAGINRDAKNSKYSKYNCIAWANGNSHTATTATIMQLTICRCSDVITLITVNKTCQYHNGEAITEVITTTTTTVKRHSTFKTYKNREKKTCLMLK